MEKDFILGTGAHKSPVDKRDWTLASVGAPTDFPDSCFIEQKWLSPSMQGKIGCCVGNTFEEIVRKIVYSKTKTEEKLSFRFVYAVCKSLDGVKGEGTYPSLAAKVIRKYGVPLEKYCPNDVSLDHEKFVYNRELKNIPEEAFRDALKRRAGADMIPSDGVTIEGIKQAINYAKENNGGVAILRKIGNTYWTDKNGNSTWSADKLLPIRVQDRDVSGHEEFLYGYDTEKNTGRVRLYWINSWSERWADNGRGWEYADVWLKNIIEIRVSVARITIVPTFRYHFRGFLNKGTSGAQVVALQHVLSLESLFGYPTFTGYFGNITKTGVIKLQEKYASEILTPLGLSHGTGFVGRSTIAWLNRHYGN